MHARAPLFRDPLFDGAADPTVIHHVGEDAWWMVYTNRRTTITVEEGLSWLFGSDLGVASSDDGGHTWSYRGIVEGLGFEWGRGTFWAPEIFAHAGTFHMYVSYIRGIPSPGDDLPMLIHHYTSADLISWQHQGPLTLSSESVIDACVIERPGGGFRMWFKDQTDGSSTWTADSDDLYAWTVTGRALQTEGGHEGPNVFLFQGWYWLLVDTWSGQRAHRSKDLESWEEAGTVLAGAHSQVFARTDDVGPGLHADVVVDGDRAWIFYFTHPDRVGTEHPTIRSRRSSIQVAELTVVDDRLVCDRDHVDRPQLGTARRPV